MISRSCAVTRHRNAALAAVIALAAALPLPGCGPGPKSEPPAAADLPPLTLSTPEDAARCAVQTIRAELSAIARRDRAGVEKARDQLVRAAAEESISSRLSSGIRAEMRENATRQVTGRWGAILAAYANRLDLDAGTRASDLKSAVVISYPLRGDAAPTRIRVECVQVAGEWRVASIDFAPPRAAASQPSSRG